LHDHNHIERLEFLSKILTQTARVPKLLHVDDTKLLPKSSTACLSRFTNVGNVTDDSHRRMTYTTIEVLIKFLHTTVGFAMT